MKRTLFLIHWNQAEAVRLAMPLQEAGWRVEIESKDGERAGSRILADPPEVVIIYLTRLPSHGRETAHYLRSRLEVPIVFVEGDPEKVEVVRAKVPDAIYVSAGELRATLDELE